MDALSVIRSPDAKSSNFWSQTCKTRLDPANTSQRCVPDRHGLLQRFFTSRFVTRMIYRTPSAGRLSPFCQPPQSCGIPELTWWKKSLWTDLLGGLSTPSPRWHRAQWEEQTQRNSMARWDRAPKRSRPVAPLPSTWRRRSPARTPTNIRPFFSTRPLIHAIVGKTLRQRWGTKNKTKTENINHFKMQQWCWERRFNLIRVRNGPEGESDGQITWNWFLMLRYFVQMVKWNQ